MAHAASTVRIAAGADPAALRSARLGLVLRRLRDHGPRSRSRLATELGLTRGAAAGLVDELEDRGLVRRGELERSGVGRPGTAVEVRRGAVVGVGAEINVDHIGAMAVDLTGAVTGQRRRGLDAARLTPDGVLDEVAALVAETVSEVTGAGTRLAGITVGVAGLVDSAEETVRLAPNLGWRDVRVAPVLRRLLAVDPRVADDVPIRLVNEASLAAMAEIDVTDPDRAEMVVLYGEVGLGGGVVTDGRLFTGWHGWAGEFGHLVVEPGGRRCGCGRTGCWETVVGLRALIGSATTPDDPVRDPAMSLEERLDRLVARARLGDRRTLDALHQVGSSLGVGSAVLADLLDPRAVVLSGYFTAFGEWLRPIVEEQLGVGVLPPAAGRTDVVISSLGPTAAVRGGAVLSLESVLADPTALVTNGEVS